MDKMDRKHIVSLLSETWAGFRQHSTFEKEHAKKKEDGEPPTHHNLAQQLVLHHPHIRLDINLLWILVLHLKSQGPWIYHIFFRYFLYSSWQVQPYYVAPYRAMCDHLFTETKKNIRRFDQVLGAPFVSVPLVPIHVDVGLFSSEQSRRIVELTALWHHHLCFEYIQKQCGADYWNLYFGSEIKEKDQRLTNILTKISRRIILLGSHEKEFPPEWVEQYHILLNLIGWLRDYLGLPRFTHSKHYQNWQNLWDMCAKTLTGHDLEDCLRLKEWFMFIFHFSVTSKKLLTHDHNDNNSYRDEKLWDPLKTLNQLYQTWWSASSLPYNFSSQSLLGFNIRYTTHRNNNDNQNKYCPTVALLIKLKEKSLTLQEMYDAMKLDVSKHTEEQLVSFNHILATSSDKIWKACAIVADSGEFVWTNWNSCFKVILGNFWKSQCIALLPQLFLTTALFETTIGAILTNSLSLEVNHKLLAKFQTISPRLLHPQLDVNLSTLFRALAWKKHGSNSSIVVTDEIRNIRFVYQWMYHIYKPINPPTNTPTFEWLDDMWEWMVVENPNIFAKFHSKGVYEQSRHHLQFVHGWDDIVPKLKHRVTKQTKMTRDQCDRYRQMWHRMFGYRLEEILEAEQYFTTLFCWRNLTTHHFTHVHDEYLTIVFSLEICQILKQSCIPATITDPRLMNICWLSNSHWLDCALNPESLQFCWYKYLGSQWQLLPLNLNISIYLFERNQWNIYDDIHNVLFQPESRAQQTFDIPFENGRQLRIIGKWFKTPEQQHPLVRIHTVDMEILDQIFDYHRELSFHDHHEGESLSLEI